MRDEIHLGRDLWWRRGRERGGLWRGHNHHRGWGWGRLCGHVEVNREVLREVVGWWWGKEGVGGVGGDPKVGAVAAAAAVGSAVLCSPNKLQGLKAASSLQAKGGQAGQPHRSKQAVIIHTHMHARGCCCSLAQEPGGATHSEHFSLPFASKEKQKNGEI